MEQLIPIINKLQDVVTVVDTHPLDLPQIVVLGAQSSGKSSVLESIVGRDFLPRGSGIVTRRPLVLQLIYTVVANGAKEWGEFAHLPKHKFTDFDEIRREIEADTDRVAGKNKGISYKPINLKIYSPCVVNLTLVDLPGLTKVPVGEQPADIAEQIHKMVVQFIEKPSAIILAITPANIDIANSDALKLAHSVDPQGRRTIGVLTKVDLMDKGTDCMDVLQGKVFPLSRGFIPLVLRSQHDIIQKKPISESLEAEIQFYRNHPIYKQLGQRVGVVYLAKSLNRILMTHIRDCLPDLREKVNSLLTQTRNDLEALGEEGVPTAKEAQLLNIINHFNTSYINTIDGRLSNSSATDELYGGARINYIFNDVFSVFLDNIDELGGLNDEEIQFTMTNASGPRGSLFIPEESFEQLARRQVRILEEPSQRCVDLVFDELQRIVNCIELNELTRFSSLRDKIVEVVNNLLRDCKLPCKEMVKNLLNIEMAHINTNHPDFIGGGNAIAQMLGLKAPPGNAPTELQIQYQKEIELAQKQRMDRKRQYVQQQQIQSVVKDPKSYPMGKVPNHISAPKSDFELFQTELIETLLRSYFQIVRKNVKDRVPKTIMFFMVNASKDKLQNELVRQLYREDLFDSLFEESDDVANRRENYKQTVKVLTAAQRILNEVLQFNINQE